MSNDLSTTSTWFAAGGLFPLAQAVTAMKAPSSALRVTERRVRLAAIMALLLLSMCVTVAIICPSKMGERSGSARRTTSLYDLRVTVERIEGRSVCGLAVGDYFELTESSRVRIPAGRHFCLYALQSVLPLLPAKQRRLPDSDWLEQDSLVACPDPDERVIMRIERIGSTTLRTADLT